GDIFRTLPGRAVVGRFELRAADHGVRLHAERVYVVATARRARLAGAMDWDDNHLRGRGRGLPDGAKDDQSGIGRRRRMKTFLLLCSLVVGSSLGEILSAKGVRKVGAVSFRPKALIGAAGRMVRSPYLFAGVVCLAVAFFSFISLLSYADLSFVVPLTAVSYITNTVGARFFLKERISKARWMGTLLVTLGVTIVSLDKHVEAFFRTRSVEWLTRLYAELAPDELINQAGAPIAFWALFALRAVLLACVIAAIAYYLIALASGLLWFADRRRQRALGLSYSPPATIFKPV